MIPQRTCRILLVLTAVAGSWVPLRSTTSQPPTLDTVLGRARAYVDGYHRTSAAVICDEDYRQEVWGPRKAGVGSWETVLTGERRLSSEFLLVWVPSAEVWLGFRDVVRVDGRTLPDRGTRLLALLRRADASVLGLRALADESARFNIGPADRNINEPTLALRALDPGHASRFSIKRSGQELVGSVMTWRLDFLETARPTMIQKEKHDAPVRGMLWVEPGAGEVIRTMLRVDDPTTGARGRIVVDYGMEGKIGLWVPRKMAENYAGGAVTVKGTAIYSNFRRFETSGRMLPPK